MQSIFCPLHPRGGPLILLTLSLAREPQIRANRNESITCSLLPDLLPFHCPGMCAGIRWSYQFIFWPNWAISFKISFVKFTISLAHCYTIQSCWIFVFVFNCVFVSIILSVFVFGALWDEEEGGVSFERTLVGRSFRRCLSIVYLSNVYQRVLLQRVPTCTIL